MFRSLVVLLALLHASAFMPRAAMRTRGSLSMATVAVFGGTGITGRECVYQALKAGNKVVVLARSPEKMLVPVGSGGNLADQPLKDENLTVLKGDVTNQADVDKVFAADDITGVIVALGGKTKDVGATMLTDGTTCVINGMKGKGTKRVAVVTSIGAGDR
jgi:putative NADH-flavin reductase